MILIDYFFSFLGFKIGIIDLGLQLKCISQQILGDVTYSIWFK